MGTTSVTLASGADMPLLGFGTWQMKGSTAEQSVRHALEVGYRHVDTATVYGNEREVGRALRDSGVAPGDVFVTTKLPPERVGRERETLEASLDALGVDAVDLWLIHWLPSRGGSEAMWGQMIGLRDEGLARSIGVSNFGLAEIDRLIDATGERPVVNQIPWAPALFDGALLAAHWDRGVVLEGYSPFKESDLRDPVLVAIADAHGVTPAQVILRWHLEHEVVAIPKSATPARIAENFDVFGFGLSPEEMQRLDALAG